jgi:hypothetical protein
VPAVDGSRLTLKTDSDTAPSHRHQPILRQSSLVNHLIHQLLLSLNLSSYCPSHLSVIMATHAASMPSQSSSSSSTAAAAEAEASPTIFHELRIGSNDPVSSAVFADNANKVRGRVYTDLDIDPPVCSIQQLDVSVTIRPAEAEDAIESLLTGPEVTDRCITLIAPPLPSIGGVQGQIHPMTDESYTHCDPAAAQSS